MLSWGGMKGLAYLGFLQAINKCKLRSKIQNYSGTSAGSSTAAFLATGISEDALMNTLICSIMKGNFWLLK